MVWAWEPGNSLAIAPADRWSKLAAHSVLSREVAGSNPARSTQFRQHLHAVVVNSADTSVFHTEEAGSMPAGRSRRPGQAATGAVCPRSRYAVPSPDGSGPVPVRRVSRVRAPPKALPRFEGSAG